MDNRQTTYEYGVQPIDAILKKHHLKNPAIVEASTEQLSHKMIAKARRGRKLSRKVQEKIIRAVNSLTKEKYSFRDLFNY